MKYPNIEAERARNGMSSENLAAALGVSRKTLYNWCATGNIPQSALFQGQCVEAGSDSVVEVTKISPPRYSLKLPPVLAACPP